MSTDREARLRAKMFRLGCVLGAWSFVAIGAASAQTGAAAAGGTPPPPAAPGTAVQPVSVVDKGAASIAPADAKPSLPDASHGNAQSGITPVGPIATPATDPAPTVQPPPDAQPVTTGTAPPPGAAPPAGPPVPAASPAVAPASPPAVQPASLPAEQPPGPVAAPSPITAAAQPPLPEPVSLDRPTVIDTARLTAGDKVVSLFGIIGLTGEPAQGLQGYLAAAGNRVTCQAQPSADYVCLLADGSDLAEAALINGAARAKDDAPASYHEQEAAAQVARRGVWVNLPPPPVVVKHPTVPNTATLVADGHSYVLEGLQGLGAPYSVQLQGYIAANGDTLTCQAQPVSGHFICMMPDDTDIAKIALVNGAARVAADAPDSYRLQQREALNNRRGYWMNPAPDVVVATTTADPGPPEYAFVAGDDGADGITYVGGAPTAMIDGEAVFLVFAGAAGWGYYDHFHRWRDAPGHYRSHLDHFHPGGHGLRGYDHEFARRPGGGDPGGFHPGGVHMAGMSGAPVHPGFAPGHVGPGPAGGGFTHPGAAGPGFHPGGGAPGFQPGGGAPGFHPAGGVPSFHPGGGAPGFHPGGAAAPAIHAAAPVVHAAAAPAAHSGGGGGQKHK